VFSLLFACWLDFPHGDPNKDACTMEEWTKERSSLRKIMAHALLLFLYVEKRAMGMEWDMEKCVCVIRYMGL
jgi:hypothetical protein